MCGRCTCAAESGKIPELKRVIVAYENKIAMEETLEAAIARIFAGGDGRAPEDASHGAAAGERAFGTAAAPAV